MQTILNQQLFIIKLAFNQNTKMLKIKLTCLLLSLGLTRLVVSLSLVLSMAVMLMREKERDQSAEWEAAVCSSSTKEYTSHNPHLIHHIHENTPLHASHHLTPHSATEQICHQLLTTIWTNRTGKAHSLFRLTLLINTIHIKYCLIQSSYWKFLHFAYSQVTMTAKFSTCTLM